MGGGIGLSAHAGHRIVTERSRLAMPETGIGLIPDVGGTWLLARAPGETGVYLGLTGDNMNAADAIYARFSDTFVPSRERAALTERLIDARGGTVKQVISAFGQDPGASQLAAQSSDIDRAFSGGSVDDIFAALARSDCEWAEKTTSSLKQKSPKALKLTLAAIRGARTLRSLDQALIAEFRLTVRLFEDGEFPEGVRALIIDKDRKPKWSPPELSRISEDFVRAYLAPLPEGEELTFT
jgi:enoyl-CoA hydratase